jgi:phosphate transport system permease protein
MSVTVAISTPKARDMRVAAMLGRRRRRASLLASILATAATGVALVLLASILFTLAWRGLAGLKLTVFTHMTRPPGSDGGLLNAIIGSLVQTSLGTLIGTPIGLMVGTYLAEYARESTLGAAVRFVSDILLSAPSILIGLFVYVMLVEPLGGFSGLAGSMALAIIVIPVVVRTTEDMLRLIPNTLREAAIALGAPKWKMIVFICYRAALDGLTTGVLLAIARVAGETAPLLFTSFGNSTAIGGLREAMASVPVAIYQYASSAFDDWVDLAWTGALLITVGVLAANIIARYAVRRRG